MDIQVTYITVNRRGQPQRDQQRVPGPTITLGRGTQCQIHLPDPRIALQHAQITVSESEATIAAETGRLQVNGRAVDGAKLNIGDSVEVGPYLLEVEQPPAGVPLAVSVKLVVPLASFGGEGGRRFALQAPRLSKRRLSYLAVLGTLLLCLLVPIAPDLLGYSKMQTAGTTTDSTEHIVRTVSSRLLQTWNPGPVSQAHQPFGADCYKCHQFPFVQVRDLSCISCHKSIKEHVPVAEMTGPQGKTYQDTRCAECHRDHKGVQMAPHSQDECAACHRDVKTFVTDAKSGDVTDFHSNHPEFRLSLLDANKPDAIRRVRQAKPAAAEMVERSNLKFSHKVHLDPAGVRDPGGKRVPGSPGAQDPRTVMQCKDCHQPNEGGRLIAPVVFEAHCQRCHSLSFEPGAPKRQAVHGDEEEVATMVREFYARLVLGDVPAGVTPPQGLPRARPGAVLTTAERRASLKIADQMAEKALNELFTEQPEKPREVCIKCHEVSRKPDGGGWKVAPVYFTKIWMPQALFTHAKHSTEECTVCHKEAKNSQKASDISMPDIAICRECHVGAKSVEGKVTSDCATCHKFHAGRDFWHGELQAQMQPRGKK